MKLRRCFLLLASLVAAASAPAQEATLPSPLALGLLGPDITWRFIPSEPPSPTGEVIAEEIDGKAAGVLRFDFTKDGKYAAVTTRIQVPEGYNKIQMRIRTEQPQRISLRVRDSSGQFHQYTPPYSTRGGTQPGEWEGLRWDLTNPSHVNHWGGANDGKFHFPLRELWLCLQNPRNLGTGTLCFSEAQALP